jgi:trans-2-enoyl-CoA reductase
LEISYYLYWEAIVGNIKTDLIQQCGELQTKVNENRHTAKRNEGKEKIIGRAQ